MVYKHWFNLNELIELIFFELKFYFAPGSRICRLQATWFKMQQKLKNRRQLLATLKNLNERQTIGMKFCTKKKKKKDKIPKESPENLNWNDNSYYYGWFAYANASIQSSIRNKPIQNEWVGGLVGDEGGGGARGRDANKRYSQESPRIPGVINQTKDTFRILSGKSIWMPYLICDFIHDFTGF